MSKHGAERVSVTSTILASSSRPASSAADQMEWATVENEGLAQRFEARVEQWRLLEQHVRLQA